jgi:hypothetical protein
MKLKELIGRKIKDILVWSQMNVGGLDQAKVFIRLDNDKIVCIPWDVDSENLECIPKKGSTSLFRDLRDNICYSVISKRKSKAVLEAQKKQELSWIGRLKKTMGFQRSLLNEYEETSQIEVIENKVKYLKDQIITDFLMLKNDSWEQGGFLELENGYILTETETAPHGTGMAGFHFYENLQQFEERHRNPYQRYKNQGS